MIRFDVLGRPYDTEVPVFLLLTDGGYYDRLAKRYMTQADLDFYAKGDKHIYLPSEVGYAPADYVEANHFQQFASEPPPAEEPRPIPTMSWSKAEVLAWLINEGVDLDQTFRPNTTKAEMVAFCNSIEAD